MRAGTMRASVACSSSHIYTAQLPLEQRGDIYDLGPLVLREERGQLQRRGGPASVHSLGIDAAVPLAQERGDDLAGGARGHDGLVLALRLEDVLAYELARLRRSTAERGAA